MNVCDTEETSDVCHIIDVRVAQGGNLVIDMELFLSINQSSLDFQLETTQDCTLNHGTSASEMVRVANYAEGPSILQV